jgi:hypothetical protein
MFEPVFEGLRKATEATIQMQQEVIKKWFGLLPGAPALPVAGVEQMQKFQKKWAEYIEEALKTQRAALEAQFEAGRKAIEGTFKLSEARDLEELRTRSIALWEQCVESLRKTFEAQVREYQAAVTKWTEVMARGAA